MRSAECGARVLSVPPAVAGGSHHEVVHCGDVLPRLRSPGYRRSRYSRSFWIKVLLIVLLLTPPASSQHDTLALAIETNARLKTELEWELAGKTQRGWEMYTPLIADLIGLRGVAAEQPFARALSRWQAREELAATGMLDLNTWSKMIATWQERRLKNRDIPKARRLVSATVADLYDPERPPELRFVERKTYSAYKRMYRAARRELKLGPDDKFLKIMSAFRSREYQEKLRRETPGATRGAIALFSTHFTGRALDLYVGGEPVETRDDNRALQTQTAAYRWLVRNAGRFGFQPYFYEPWHWEYVS